MKQVHFSFLPPFVIFVYETIVYLTADSSALHSGFYPNPKRCSPIQSRQRAQRAGQKTLFFTIQRQLLHRGYDHREPKPTNKNSDVKFQLSISQRLTKSKLPFDTYLFITYTQKAFWNVFQESLPMYDLNFNPGIGLSHLVIHRNRLIGQVSLLIEHESNGKDSIWSRSWNKISFMGALAVDRNVELQFKTWIPIIDSGNNRDILKYCGIFQLAGSYISDNRRFGATVILTKRSGWNFNFNTVIELNARLFPNENQYFFIQYYNGYGEGLLDYNKFHSRLRVGFVIKPQNFSNY